MLSEVLIMIQTPGVFVLLETGSHCIFNHAIPLPKFSLGSSSNVLLHVATESGEGEVPLYLEQTNGL